MRKVNALVSVLNMILFVIHMIWGGLELAGMTKGGSFLFTMLTHLLLTGLLVHVLISVVLTIETVRISRKAGKAYPKQNRLFWVRRISGIALLVLIAVHVVIFSGTTGSGAYRLHLFASAELVSQLLLTASLLVHLACNIAPLRIALGLEDRKKLRVDVLLVLSVLLLLAGIAFVVYFIRWRTVS